MNVAIVDHHLNNYHADKFLSILTGPLASEGVKITAAWESDPSGDDWCAKNGIRRATSAEDAVHDADAVMLLAPDNIEDHHKLSQAVLPFGKPTLIDKFLAPTLADARAIVDLAAHHRAPIFSSSSLRYAVELEAVKAEFEGKEIPEAYVRGLANWDNYGVHTIAMALRIMGSNVKRVIDTGTATARTVTLDFGGSRRAVIDVRTAENEWEEFNWRFAFRTGDHYVSADIRDYDGFYTNLMREACQFFKTAHPPITTHEMLTTVAVIESANNSLGSAGEWIGVG